MHTGQAIVAFAVYHVLGCPVQLPAAPRHECGKVELITDARGIPHAVSDTDAGAFYALGWATARDRGFQMTFSLRIMKGRLAEILGAKKKVTRTETDVHSDRMARTFGWRQAAEKIVAGLDRQTVALLQAYTQWVPLNRPDSAPTLCPVGHSDRLDSHCRTSTAELWQQGNLHPTHLSRAAIENLARSRDKL